MPLAYLCGALTVASWSHGDGTAPLYWLAALAAGLTGGTLFLRLLVRYALDPDLRRACVLVIAPELLGLHLHPTHLDGGQLDRPTGGSPVSGEGGERS